MVALCMAKYHNTICYSIPTITTTHTALYCPTGMVYAASVSNCPATCAEPDAETDCPDPDLRAGCVCPEGWNLQ